MVQVVNRLASYLSPSYDIHRRYEKGRVWGEEDILLRAKHGAFALLDTAKVVTLSATSLLVSPLGYPTLLLLAHLADKNKKGGQNPKPVRQQSRFYSCCWRRCDYGSWHCCSDMGRSKSMDALLSLSLGALGNSWKSFKDNLYWAVSPRRAAEAAYKKEIGALSYVVSYLG